MAIQGMKKVTETGEAAPVGDLPWISAGRWLEEGVKEGMGSAHGVTVPMPQQDAAVLPAHW